jgi:hypothetical protein
LEKGMVRGPIISPEQIAAPEFHPALLNEILWAPPLRAQQYTPEKGGFRITFTEVAGLGQANTLNIPRLHG